MNQKITCYIVFMIALASLPITGCGKSDSKRPVIDYEFRQGTKGLEMSFVENSPPNELYEDTDFLISFDVSNQGAYDIENGIFALSIEDSYMEAKDWNGYIVRSQSPLQKATPFAIKGKSQDFPEGEKSMVTVRAKTRPLDQQTETHTSAVLLTACYPYKTILVQDVCIDPDVFKTIKGKKVCEVKSIGLSGQGAPVAVTKIEPAMLYSEDYNMIKPQFNIYVKNVGNGEVFNSNSIEDACSSSPLTKENVNVIKVSAKLSDKPLQCKPQQLRLSKKENTVRCTLESGFSKTGSAFISPLVVELEYGYSFTISKNVIIKRMIK